jgi:DNA-binding transcriptional LysR family regulator
MSQIDHNALPAIWTLIQVIDAGSLSGAARNLNLSPSAVSKQLSRLEARLGTRLLQRTTRRVQATAEGMALYERCRPLFDGLGEAEEAVRTMRSALSGRLRLTATPAFGRARLVPAIGEFARRHSELKVELVLTSQRADLVEEGIDLAVREGTLEDSSLISTRLTEMQIVLCASPAYLARRHAPTTLAGVTEHDVVSVPLAGLDRNAWRIELSHGRPLEWQPGLVVNDLFAVRELALDGFGLAPLPDYLVETDLAEGRLVRVLPEVALPRQPVTALYPERRFQPARVKVLVDFLVDRFARHRAGPCSVDCGI